MNTLPVLDDLVARLRARLSATAIWTLPSPICPSVPVVLNRRVTITCGNVSGWPRNLSVMRVQEGLTVSMP